MYAKPVPVNVSRLRNSRNSSVVVSLVGPAVNIALAVVLGFAFKSFVAGQVARFNAVDGTGPIWAQFLFVAGYANVILAVIQPDPAAAARRLGGPGAAAAAEHAPRVLPDPALHDFLPLVLIVLDPSALNSLFNWAFIHYAQQWCDPRHALKPPGGASNPAARMARSRVGPAILWLSKPLRRAPTPRSRARS